MHLSSNIRIHTCRFKTSLLFSASLCTLAAVTAQAQRPLLTPHVAQLVLSGRAVRLAAKAPGDQLQLVLSLPLRNQAALTALLADLQNPASPSYRQYLTPAQFDAQFGPTQDDYTTLVQWARANALDVVAKSDNKRILTVSASTALINRAFHITETNYHDSVRNRDFISPDREPTTDLTIPLLAVSGLDTSNPPTTNYGKKPTESDEGTLSALAQRSSTGITVQPLTAFPGSGASGSYLPSDMRAAYYGTGPLTGTGQSVAIFSYDGYNASDLALWYSSTGVAPSPVPITNVLTGGYNGAVTSGQDGEQVLDILQVSFMAPGLSHIYFYEGKSAVTELNQMVSDNNAHVVTSSWAGGDFGPACDPAFMQMAAQGTTFLQASGDSGAFNADTYQPPTLDQNVVVVGGTDMITASPGGAWASETAWNRSGGGWYDPNYAIPSWQQASGIITATNNGSTLYRNSPDIAAEADYNNSTASLGKFETGFGGTSFAAPRMAGYLALANQQSVANFAGTVGFINPALYEYGQRSTYSSIFHDITSGSAPALYYYNGVRSSFSSTTGYDLVTGWGSPNGQGLMNALTGPNFSLTLDASTYAVAIGANAVANLSVVPADGFTGTTTLAVANLPAGISYFYAQVGNTFRITFNGAAGSTQTSGTATFTVTSGAITHSTTALINLTKRANFDFSIAATSVAAQQTLTAVSNITVADKSGYFGTVDLSVTNLPAGVTASFSTASTSSTSVLTFSPTIATVPGTYTVLLTGTITANGASTGVSHTIPVTFTLAEAPSVLPNGDFENGIASWTFTSTTAGADYLCAAYCGFYPHSGINFAFLNGFGGTDTDTLSQVFTVGSNPSKTIATLSFWLWIATNETTTTAANDTFTVSVTPAGGTAINLGTVSNLNKSTGYVLYTYDMSAYLGKTVTLTFQGINDNNGNQTSFLLDDISVVIK